MLITSNLKYLILLIGSWITTFLIVGICMLDVLIATNFLTFVGLIVIYLFGVVIFSQYLKVNSVFKQILIGGGLIIYFLISVYFQKSDFIYMPPLISLFAFYSPFMLIYFNLHRVFHIIFILWFSIYSFFLYPYLVQLKFVNRSLITLDWEVENIKLHNINGDNLISSFKNKVVLVETWNETCGNCFQGMWDLHPLFLDLELKYLDFKHYYIYVPLNKGRIDPFNFSKLPFKNMPIVEDINSRFYKKYSPEAFPQFFIIQNGKIIYSLEGYHKRYKTYYSTEITSQILKALKEK